MVTHLDDTQSTSSRKEKTDTAMSQLVNGMQDSI